MQAAVCIGFISMPITGGSSHGTEPCGGAFGELCAGNAAVPADAAYYLPKELGIAIKSAPEIRK